MVSCVLCQQLLTAGLTCSSVCCVVLCCGVVWYPVCCANNCPLQVTDIPKLIGRMEEYLMDHNAMSKRPMNLAIFL